MNGSERVLRVGNGLDVHAFVEGVPLWLGGVQLQHPRGLAGHSDGDAAVHALIDALLGAAGRGDIGTWFPSSDDTWAGVRSSELLDRVWSALSQDGWRLENADITIVAREPRLAEHRDAMQAALSAILGARAVSVKATTTDGLGLTGRGEGLAAIASVLLSRENPVSTLAG